MAAGGNPKLAQAHWLSDLGETILLYTLPRRGQQSGETQQGKGPPEPTRVTAFNFQPELEGSEGLADNPRGPCSGICVQAVPGYSNSFHDFSGGLD